MIANERDVRLIGYGSMALESLVAIMAIIAATTRSADEVEVRAFEVGAADFIRKPVKNSVLLARVAKVMKDKE